MSASSSATSSAAFAAGAAIGTAAGYGLAFWLLPYGGVSGALAELTDKERLADAFVSLKERFAKLTASLSAPAAKAEGEAGEAAKGDSATVTAHEPEAHPLASDPKMVLVVRRDLEMGKGKIGAQCGHAAVGLYKKLRRARDDRLKVWEQAGATKVCLRVDDEISLLAVAEGARRMGLPSHVVADAGRTQVSAGSRTVLAVLGAGAEVDKLTGRLKLL